MMVVVLIQTMVTVAAFARQVDTTKQAGVMIAGELWDSFLPPNVSPTYFEQNLPLRSTFLRIGNFDRLWSTPTHMWPGGWPYGMFWGKGMYLLEFNPDSTWNPPAIGEKTNPSHHAGAGGKYAMAAFGPALLGSDDPLRNYARETRWVDPVKRTHAVYEAGWPTTIGIDVTMKIHQFTLNWNNFNDFILVEITLKNTGVLDMNGDGVPDSAQTGRVGRNGIRALALMAHGEVFGSYNLATNGGRGSRLGSARAIGYVGDPDSHSAPWDMVVAFAGESAKNTRDMGMNDGVNKFYTDVWSAWSWVAVKQGGGESTMLRSLPDKKTLYGTHGIGVGPERGWYASAGQGRGLATNGLGSGGINRNPKIVHTATMGTWYQDGGRSRDSMKLDLSPHPDFFASGIAGDPTTFIPKSNPSRPNGDRKLFSDLVYNEAAFEVNPYEPSWKKGFTGQDNFDGDLLSGVGPFSLDVGESMTIVWTEAGGYRLQGVQNAVAAARWAFENGYNIPEPPAAPDVLLATTFENMVRVRWDRRAESHMDFSGYKIWRVSQRKDVNWLTGGMRALDQYWRSTTVGPVSVSLLQPVNANRLPDPIGDNATGPPDSWGPYELVAIIPKNSLTSAIDLTVTGYHYLWEDRNVNPGFSYWYYVSAFTSGHYDLGPSYAGVNERTTSTIESSNLNRNGSTGLWRGVYPFTTLHRFFPTTISGLKDLGAAFQVKTPAPSGHDVLTGNARIGVKPNPYKRMAFWDSRTDSFDHHLLFYNLPHRSTLTILDVSGQIIHQFHHDSGDPNNGTLRWNMFSRGGIEVASGLYIYLVEYEGGQHIGYFSIMR